ncbi:Nuclear envelope integral membrane protein 1 [Triplophysa tibetana]|uniref:Nuclear envelope integral membrane protein 1 n=1 Tax=Triplophysa tibetana TaxID=1572043 RepID=A0A5A9P0T8_9TELE|nr:Nuclear envelope integral membrane protein 1 [Triplophysa tibetana]
MRKVDVFIQILIIVWAGWRSVEGNRDYSYADCTYVKGDSAHSYSGSRCFCYSPGTVIRWKDCWSTFKVNVTSDENVFIMFPMETRSCQHPDDFLSVTNCFVEHYWPSSVQREKALDIPLVNEDVCFMTKSPRSNTEYTLHVSHKRYVLISGLVSFAVCYKLGPITNRHTLGFMTLCMQAVGIVLLYQGISYPTAFYILLTLLLFRKILHLVRSLLVGMCKLAEFLRNGCHVTPEELQSHESHYGLGGAYHEGMLFNSSSSDGQPQNAEEENIHEELEQNYTPTPNNLPGPSVCPYPPVNCSPQPEPMDAEDQDFF